MAWDIANATYTSAFPVSAQDPAPRGVTFSPDGTIMFVMGYASDSVYRYDLTTAWDITTATYVSAKSVSAQDGAPYTLAFSPDGTNMFVVGDDNNSVYRYDLTTAWDITTGASVGTYVFTGTAVGRKQMSGSATGTYSWDGEAVGTRPARGSAAGSFLFVSVASGTRHTVGTSVGVHVWDSLAVGTRHSRGASTGAHEWDGTGRGGVLRNLTFTAHIAPAKWAASVGPSRITAQINRPAWVASVEAR